MSKTLTALTIAVALTLYLAPAGTPATSANSICPTLTGQTWHKGGKSGNKYRG